MAEESLGQLSYKMEWQVWSLQSFIVSAFLSALSSGETTSEGREAIRCMLAQTAPQTCSQLPAVSVPNSLVNALHNSPAWLQEALAKSKFDQLKEEELTAIPVSLLFLVPRGRLSDVDTSKLAALVRKHVRNTAVVHQIAASIHHNEKLRELILLLLTPQQHPPMPQEVVQILGETISLPDISNEFIQDLLPKINQPLIAYIPLSVLSKLDDEKARKLLFSLQSWESPQALSREAVSTVAHMVTMQKNFSITHINWFVTGLSPDEVRENTLIQNSEMDIQHILSFKLDPMQVRALFERLYPYDSDHLDWIQLLHKLSPELLQKLDRNTLNYDILIRAVLKNGFPSLPTACQIREYVKEDCVRKRLPRGGSKEEWGDRIHYLGRWVYTLPMSTLQEFLQDPPPTSSLENITSPALSPLQAYYLTGKGSGMDLTQPISILHLDTLLHALPAAQLVNRKLGDINKQVMKYLGAKAPVTNMVRSLALMHKLGKDIGDKYILDSLLKNADVNEFLLLLFPRDLARDAPNMLRFFASDPTYAPIVRKMPQPFLAAIMEYNEDSLNWAELLENSSTRSRGIHLLLGGMSCYHIDAMETALFIPIMAQYNMHRYKAFPKNLQICCVRKLWEFLKMKQGLSQTDPDHGLISLLEPIEIHSIGGYVLSSLPVDALRFSPYLGHIVTSIGKLSNAELILAANITQLRALAEFATTTDKIVNVYAAGNLVWFAPSEVSAPELKWRLEAGQLDRTLCLPAVERGHVAVMLQKHFGLPGSWSASVLAALSDLLIVFTDSELELVQISSWTASADTLTSHYADIVDWIYPTPFYQVCANLLGESEGAEYVSSVGRLMRWRLLASQLQLDTVRPMALSLDDQHDRDSLVSESDPLMPFDPDLDIDEPNDASTDIKKLEESEPHMPFDPDLEVDDSGEDLDEDSEETTTEETSQMEAASTKYTTSNEITQKLILTPTTANYYSTAPSFEENKATSTEMSVTSLNLPPTIRLLYNASHSTPTVSPVVNLITSPFMKNYAENGSDLIIVSTSTIPSINTTDINIAEMRPNQSQPDPPKNIIIDESVNTNYTTIIANSLEFKGINATANSTKPWTNQIAVKNASVGYNSSGIRLLNTSINDSNSALQIQKINSQSEIDENKINGVGQNISYDHNDGDDYEEPSASDENMETNSIIIDENIKHPDVKRRRRSSLFGKHKVQLSCNAVRMVGSLASLALTEDDLMSMKEDDEWDECRIEFGAMDLPKNLKKILWAKINKVEGVHMLNNLLQAVENKNDLFDLNFDIREPWALENIHAFTTFNNNSNVLSKVVREVKKFTEAKLAPELVAALGMEICSVLEPNEFSVLDLPLVGMWGWSGCAACLPQLASRAVELLGSVERWSQHHVYTLQSLVAGLSINEWKSLAESPSKPLAALQPTAVKCLSGSHLKILSPDHIKMIPTLSLEALTKDQLGSFSNQQLEALREAKQVSVPSNLIPIRLQEVSVATTINSASVISIFVVLCLQAIYYVVT